jgi:hypothetical protein
LVFGGESQELQVRHQEHTRTHSRLKEDFKDYIRDFQETSLSRRSARNMISLGHKQTRQIHFGQMRYRRYAPSGDMTM